MPTKEGMRHIVEKFEKRVCTGTYFCRNNNLEDLIKNRVTPYSGDEEDNDYCFLDWDNDDIEIVIRIWETEGEGAEWRLVYRNDEAIQKYHLEEYIKQSKMSNELVEPMPYKKRACTDRCKNCLFNQDELCNRPPNNRYTEEEYKKYMCFVHINNL